MHEEILMSRISSNMDKLLGHLMRDNKVRKANKKVMYPISKINPEHPQLVQRQRYAV